MNVLPCWQSSSWNGHRERESQRFLLLRVNSIVIIVELPKVDREGLALATLEDTSDPPMHSVPQDRVLLIDLKLYFRHHCCCF